MVDDMGGEDHRSAVLRQLADKPFQLALVDRIEARKRLVEDHQIRLVDQRAEELDGLRHALRQFLDLLLDRMAEAVFLHHCDTAPTAFETGQAAQAAHECDRVGRLHRGVEPALFGQVPDPAGDALRAILAEDAAHALVGVDDAQNHAQGGGLARAIGAENAVDRATRHGDVHAVHGQRVAEPFDEAAGLDRIIVCRHGFVAPLCLV